MVVRDVGMPISPDRFGRDMEEYVRDRTDQPPPSRGIGTIQRTCCCNTTHSGSICTDEHSGKGSGSGNRCLAVRTASTRTSFLRRTSEYVLYLACSVWKSRALLPAVGLHVPTEATRKCLLHAGSDGATFTMCLRWRLSEVVEILVGDTTRVVPQMNLIGIVAEACDSSMSSRW